MDFKEIENLGPVEIHKKLRDIKGKLFEARMKNAMGQLTNPLSIRAMRRDVARLRTALTKNTKAN